MDLLSATKPIVSKDRNLVGCQRKERGDQAEAIGRVDWGLGVRANHCAIDAPDQAGL